MATNLEEEGSIPDYVCCVLTDGIWAIFLSTLLIVVLMTVATLKYLKKYLAQSQFTRRNLKLMSRFATEDGKNAAAIIRKDDIPVDQFIKYCTVRRKKGGVNELEFVQATSTITTNANWAMVAEDATANCQGLDTAPVGGGGISDACRNTTSSSSTTVEASKKENYLSNHSHLSVPYDFNRVRLAPPSLNDKDDDEHNDYINASRIVSKDDQAQSLGRDWIVTQGPLMTTANGNGNGGNCRGGAADFWRMVWQENSKVIVMLTKTFECVKVMCAQYWPNNAFACSSSKQAQEEQYGEIFVSLVKEEVYAHYKISTLSIRKDSEKRIVKHFHYLEWPVYAQADSSSFLLFLNHLQEELETQEKAEIGSGGDINPSGSDAAGPKKTTDSSPPIVHCHDGGGRSGAFLAIQANLFMINNSDKINVFQTLQWLRQQRKGLVANADQYRFIYDVLEDYVVCGETQIAAEKLKLQMAMLANSSGTMTSSLQASPSSSSSASDGFDAEFRQLSSLRAHYSIGDCAAGHRTENRSKNRNPSVVPPDTRRPYLTSFQNTRDGGDYINAVFIDSYVTAGAILASEWPMAHTEANFWSMVYDHDVRAIILLDPPSSSSASTSQETQKKEPSNLKMKKELRQFNRFWPSSDSDSVHQFGGLFSVEMLRHNKFSEGIDQWDLGLKKLSLLPLSITDVSTSCLDNGSSKRGVGGGGGGAIDVKLFQLSGDQADISASGDGTAGMAKLVLHLSEMRRRNNNGSTRGSSSAAAAAGNVVTGGGGLGRGGRVAVVSRDGVSKIGVFCAASYSLETIDLRGCVDVFQATRNAKKFRPQLVPTINEYKLCYELVSQFVTLRMKQGVI